MQTVKKVFSVFLCCVLLAAFAPMTHAADTLLEEVWASYPVPSAGETFDFAAVTVPDGAQYTAKIECVYARDLQTEPLTGNFTVEKGVLYYVCIRFTTESGCTIEPGKTVFYINDRDADFEENTQMVIDTFIDRDNNGSDDLVLFGRFDFSWLFADFARQHPVIAALLILFSPVLYVIDTVESTVIIIRDWVSGWFTK